MTPHARVQRREELCGQLKYARDKLAASEAAVTEAKRAYDASLAQREKDTDTLAALETECVKLAEEASNDFLCLIQPVAREEEVAF